MQEGNYNYHKDGDKYYLEYKHNGKSSRIVISEAEKSEIDATVSEDYLKSDTNTLLKSQFPTQTVPNLKTPAKKYLYARCKNHITDRSVL